MLFYSYECFSIVVLLIRYSAFLSGWLKETCRGGREGCHLIPHRSRPVTVIMAVAFLVAVTSLASVSHGYEVIGEYMPVSDVLEHAQVSLDVAALNEKLTGEVPDYTGAAAIYSPIYQEGMHSCKSPTKRRTIQGFARKDLAGESFYDSFAAAGFLAPSYWDSWMLEALDGSGIFEGLSDIKRVACIKKGVMGILTLYASHELEAAVVKARDPAKRGHGGEPKTNKNKIITFKGETHVVLQL